MNHDLRARWTRGLPIQARGGLRCLILALATPWGLPALGQTRPVPVPVESDQASFRVVKPRLLIPNAAQGAEGDMIEDMAIDPSGKWLSIGCQASKAGIGRGCNGGASLFDLQTGRKVAVVVADHDAEGVEFSPSGDLLLVADRGGGVTFWDVAARRSIERVAVASAEDKARALNNGSHAEVGVSFTPDGRQLRISPSHQGKMRAWDVATRREVAPWTTRPDLSIHDMLFRPAGAVFAVGTIEDQAGFRGDDPPSRLVLWDVTAGRQVWERQAFAPFRLASFTDDGEQIVVRSFDLNDPQSATRPVMVLDRATGNPAPGARLPTRNEEVASGPNGRLRLTTTELVFDEKDRLVRGSVVRLTDVATNQLKASFIPDP